jgi:type II secretory pathway component PulK
VLVVALVVLVAITFIALTLAREERVEVQVAARTADDVRTRALADSCIDKVMAYLKQDDTPGDTLADQWRDDETTWRNFQLGTNNFSAHCWVVFGEEDPGDGKEVRYGVRDEASKLNVNTATEDQLMQIPGMTQEIAEAIIDWRDTDDTPMANGAESSYYNSLTPGYNAKNGPIESIEEMLRIRGIDESILYGEDRNRNGVLDPCEDDGSRSFPPDDADGTLLRGFADYLTVYSMDMNWTKDGRARLNATKAQPADVRDRLEKQGMSTQLAQAVERYIQQRRGLQSVAELINVQNMDEANFAIAADELTNNDNAQTPGLININTAAKEVLAGLPGLTSDDVSAIMGRRINAAEDLSSPAWLLRVLTKPKLTRIFDMVTTRSYQFTVHAVVAMDDHPEMIRRIEAVIDRSYSPMRVLWRRDITLLGFPIANERIQNNPNTRVP